MQNELQIQYWVEQVALFNDQAAYEKIFLHFYDGLYTLARSFVKDEQIAEEIVSDSFINLWKNRMRLLEIENLKVYLYVSVKNLSIRFLSRNRSQPDFSLNDIFLPQMADSCLNPEDILISKSMLATLRKTIEELPPRCKLIFKLVREDGLKYKEIAQILNLSVKTIDAQMAIATKRIVQSLSLTIKK